VPIVSDRDGHRTNAFLGIGNAQSFGERLQSDYRFRAAINQRLRAQAAVSPLSLGTPIDRRDLTQPQGTSLSQVGTRATYLPPVGYGGPFTRSQATPQQRLIQGTQGMDLSDILGGITQAAQTVADIRRTWNQPDRAIMQQQYPLQAPQTTSVGWPSMVGGAVLGEAAESVYDWFSGDSPQGVPNGGGMPACSKPSDVVFKWSEKDQKYVARKKYKRRRNRLATKSDIKDLASLKGIVGQGKVMETWIATHC